MHTHTHTHQVLLIPLILLLFPYFLQYLPPSNVLYHLLMYKVYSYSPLPLECKLTPPPLHPALMLTLVCPL